MGSILVGIDGSDRGRRALDWAVRFARVVGYDVHMLAVIDEAIANKAGVGVETITETVTAALEKKRQAALESYPDMRIQASVSVGDIVGVLADSAAMHDLIVLGSHHGHTIGETIGGAKGLRVSVSTSVPTVVVPADWDAKQQGTGVVVGVGPDEAVSARAIDNVGRISRTASKTALVDKVAPVISSGLRLPSRAAAARRLASIDSSSRLISSAWKIVGTSSPRGVSQAKPRFTWLK